MAELLATVGDLQAMPGMADVPDATATMLLEMATGVVQAITGQRILRVTGDVLTIDVDELDGGTYLDLPETPVISVATVLVGATAVAGYSVQASRARIYRADGWRSATLVWADTPSTVTVTYTHGYAPGDQRLQLARAAAVSLAAGSATTPAGVTRMAIDDYQEAYGEMSGRLTPDSVLSAALRRAYGRPARSVRLRAGR